MFLPREGSSYSEVMDVLISLTVLIMLVIKTGSMSHLPLVLLHMSA